MGQPDRRKHCPEVFRAILACLLLTTPCLLTPSSAQAASRPAQERAARKACLSGDYASGVSILSDLFVDTRDPTYIFNQARCFEQNRRYDEAIARFQEYLRASPGLDAADKAAAEKHITDCQDLLAKQSSHAPTLTTAPVPVQPPATEARQPAPAPPAAPAPSPAPAVVVEQTSPPPGAAPGSGLRTAGILTASVGAAAVITGVVLNFKANSMASDMENTVGGYSQSKESSRKTYATVGWIGYSLGAACVATGAALYVLGTRSGGHDSSAVALTPVLAPDQVGAALGGTF